MKPRFTKEDLRKQPKGGYIPADRTDIRRTFERIRNENKKNEEEAKVKVKVLAKATNGS